MSPGLNENNEQLEKLELKIKQQDEKQTQLEQQLQQQEKQIKEQNQKQIQLEQQIQQLLSLTNNQIKESKELNERIIQSTSENVFKIIKEKGIETSLIKIGNQWTIGPEQPNEQYIVFRHAGYNREYGDRRFAYDGNNYSNK